MRRIVMVGAISPNKVEPINQRLIERMIQQDECPQNILLALLVYGAKTGRLKEPATSISILVHR